MNHNLVYCYFLFCIGIGQPLSMLLKLNPAVTKLNLYDIVHTPGVASDLSHCETASTSTGFVGIFFFPTVIFTESYIVLICNLPESMYPFNMGHFLFTGDEQLKDSLVGAEIVVIPAGVPRKPGMTRDDLFNTNASIVAKLATVSHKRIQPTGISFLLFYILMNFTKNNYFVS